MGRTRTLARLADRFYWTGMADDVKDWLSQCVACIKRKSPVGRHHPLGHIPTGHRWDRIAMDILDVCDPTPALQREDPVCVTLHDWVLAEEFPAWAEVKSMLPELRSLWHHRNNLSVDDNGTLWRKRSSQSTQLQLLVPKAGREQLFLS